MISRFGFASLGVCLFLVAPGCRRDVPLPDAPAPRIVSFSPALTETLCYLGLQDHIVGVTTYCRMPAGPERPRLGDMFQMNPEAILAVQPDLLLAQTSKEEMFDPLRRVAPDLDIETFEIETIDGLLSAMQRIGRLTGREPRATQAVASIRDRMHALRERMAGLDRPRVIFLMGYERPSAAGGDTFLGDIIDLAGGINAGTDLPGQRRWKDTNIEAVIRARPDLVLCLVDGPHQPAREYFARFDALATPDQPGGRVTLLSDSGWTVISPRFLERVETLAAMLHPEVMAEEENGE